MDFFHISGNVSVRKGRVEGTKPKIFSQMLVLIKKMSLLQLCLFLSNKQVIQFQSNRFSQQTLETHEESWKGKFTQRWKSARQESDWLQPALQTRTTTYGNIRDNYSSALCKASDMPVCCCSNERCLKQTLGQTREVSRNVIFCNCLKLCFFCLKDPSLRRL